MHLRFFISKIILRVCVLCMCKCKNYSKGTFHYKLDKFKRNKILRYKKSIDNENIFFYFVFAITEFEIK